MSYVIAPAFHIFSYKTQPKLYLQRPHSLIFAVQMATLNFKSLTFFLALVFGSSCIFSIISTEGRPYYGGLSGKSQLLDGLYEEAIINEAGRSSAGGKGHMFPNMRILIGIKESGPSSGQGH